MFIPRYHCVLECPVDEVFNEASDACEVCPNGQTSNGAGDACVLDCPVGKVPNGEGDACVLECPVDEVFNEASDACEVCPDGQVPNGAGDACEADAFAFDPLGCDYYNGGIGLSPTGSEDCRDCANDACEQQYNLARTQWNSIDKGDSPVFLSEVYDQVCENSDLSNCMFNTCGGLSGPCQYTWF